MKEDLEILSKMMNYQWMIENKEYSPNEIRKYYKTNKLAYRTFHSKDGFMHMAISSDGTTIKKSDYLFHINEIDKILMNSKNVLELGCGQGTNISILAERNPDMNFKGVDLYPSIDKKRTKDNIEIFEADYHNLSLFEDNFFDTVYAIETLCHSFNKIQVLKEVNRVLKKGGTFIVYDCYISKKKTDMTEEEHLINLLISSGGSAPKIESIYDFDNYLEEANLKTISKTDLTPQVIPNLRRLRNLARKYFKLGFIAKLGLRIIPKRFAGNIVLGFLMFNATNEGLGIYIEHKTKKGK